MPKPARLPADPVSGRLEVTPTEARTIAKEAYIYGFPMVDSYRIQHSYFVDRTGPEFKTTWNEIHNSARVYTPNDKSIQTPNSDTPYSYVGADLRTEPLVLTMPPIEEGRYFSAQLIDAYTQNFAYIGSRTTGNAGGSFLLAGPYWRGPIPEGIREVFRSETEFVFVLYRTQLFDANDIDRVREIQAGYGVQTLSSYLGEEPPAPAPRIDFVAPLSPQAERTSLEFFTVLDFVLRFCPTHPTERDLRSRFARIGIGAHPGFDPTTLPPALRQALEQGIQDAWRTFEEYKATAIDTGRFNPRDLAGTREDLKNNYLNRMTTSVLGIYANTLDEAYYPVYFVDAEGQVPDGSRASYELRFPPGLLPPVNSFWSVTLYELPQSLLYANPLDRYLINSPMLPSLARDPDGGITITLQHDRPDRRPESNWLPAPSGPFFVVLRLYWPKAEALDGRWTAPKLERK